MIDVKKKKWLVLAFFLLIWGVNIYGINNSDFLGLLIILIVAYSFLLIAKNENILNQNKRRENNILTAIVLVIIFCFSYLSNFQSSPPQDAIENNTDRVGIEQLIDSTFKQLVSEFQKLQSRILPDRQENDDVPKHLQVESGRFETKIYQMNQAADFEPVSTRIFSGQMVKVQLMTNDQFKSLASWVVLLILISFLLDRLFPSRRSAIVVLGLISTLSILVSIRLAEGWDEFFINLRHAYILLNHGVFSINATNMIEATVDFIPLLGTTLLGLLGLNLIDAFITMSLLGNIAVVIFSYLIVKQLTHDRTWSLFSALLAGLYPNVVWVGASGFSAVLFTGWILASSYFILFTQKRLIGLLLLATLTLVRTEGILFAVLLMTYIYIVKPLPNALRTGEWKAIIRQGLVDGSIVIIPFMLSLLTRFLVYGHAIPNPISFKNTHFDSTYFSTGLDRFSQMVSNHDLHLLIILIGLLLLANVIAWKNDTTLDAWKSNIKKLLMLNLIILAFILPYYIGGGDWFSIRWNRYGLPFNVILVLTFMTLLYGAFFLGLNKWLGRFGLLIFCFSLTIGYQRSAQFRPENFLFSTLPAVMQSNNGRWERVDKLASLGQFLHEFLPADAVVSSPEEATIMYFSKREMMGLLGVSNPEMTDMPFQPISPGDILHRKRGYASVYKNRPDVIALYEPVVTGNFEDDPALKNKIQHTLHNDIFSNGQVNIAYYRVGSFRALEKMGYRHISIFYSDRLFSLFINDRIYNDVVKNMTAKGFTYFGSDMITYSVDPELSKKYIPAVKEIMAIL